MFILQDIQWEKDTKTHKTITIDQENGVKDERVNKLRIKLQSD